MPEPTQPPDADLNGRPPRHPVRPGSPLRAVTYALVIDLGGSVALNLLLTTLYSAWLRLTGLPGDQVDDAVRHMPADSWAAIAGLVLGAGLDLLSGFICARIVQRDEWRVGAMLAGVSALCTLLLGDAGEDSQDLIVLLSLSTAACTMLGVKYGRELNARLKASTRAS